MALTTVLCVALVLEIMGYVPTPEQKVLLGMAAVYGAMWDWIKR